MGSKVKVSANQTSLAMCTHQALKNLPAGSPGEVRFLRLQHWLLCWLYLPKMESEGVTPACNSPSSAIGGSTPLPLTGTQPGYKWQFRDPKWLLERPRILLS